MTRILKTAAAAVTVTMLSMTGASATIFAKDYHDAGVWNAYDDQTQTYSMKFTDDGSKDGFWLVVSPGDNPKGDEEYAILYGDRAANRITAYTYDGANSANSYRDGQLLATFENAFTDGGTNARFGEMTMFSLDVSAINSAFDAQDGWVGTAFGAQQGIWFHQSEGSTFAYDDQGGLTNFDFGTQMWLDTSNQTTGRRTCGANNATAYYCKAGTTPTTPGGGSVPAPGGLALILMGMAGFGLRRKK